MAKQCEWCHTPATTKVNCKTADKPFSIRLCDKCIDESLQIRLFSDRDEYVNLVRRSIITGR